MANRLRNRRQSETSRILSNLADKKAAITISNNEAINSVLNENFANKTALANSRSIRIEKVKELNNEYITATQDVLDDKTLDFLIQHSRIDAPTTTAIFAGFELARASKAKKLGEQRQLEIDTLKAQQEADERLQQVRDAETQQRVEQIEGVRDTAIGQAELEATQGIRAAIGDIAADESAQARADQQAAVDARAEADRLAEIEKARIKADAENRDQVKLQTLNDLANVTDTGLEATTTVETVDVEQQVDPIVESSLISPEERQAILAETPLTDDELFIINAAREDANQTDVPLVPVQQGEELTDAEVVSLAETRGIDLSQLEVQPVVLDDPNIEQPVVNTATTDEQIVLSPEVIQQINTLNESTEGVNIDPLELQTQLRDGDIDPTGLTVEELNDLFRL